METDYLSRHHQLQERAAAYQSAFARPGTSAVGASSRLIQQQQQQAATAALAARQAAFSRRSYSLDEAPRADYDPFAIPQAGVQLLHQQPGGPTVAVAAPAASPFHPIKHLRAAGTAVTAFNGPNQRLGGAMLVDETPWSDTNLFRPSAAAGQVTRFDSRTATNAATRTAGGAVSGFWPQQSDRLLAYGDFDTAAVGSIYDNHSNVASTAAAGLPLVVDSRTKFGVPGVLSSRHRRR